MDYHRVLAARLSPAAKLLTESGAHAETLVDASPVPERTAALSAGVGMLGCHGLVIVPPYGSYVFLGTIVTDSCAFDTVSPATILHLSLIHIYLSKLILMHYKGVIMIAYQKKGGEQLGREKNYPVHRTDISFLL